MKLEPGIVHAEALRRAKAALITSGGRLAHTSAQAPLAAAGNGAQ
jgi:hypothetical protein